MVTFRPSRTRAVFTTPLSTRVGSDRSKPSYLSLNQTRMTA
jgi:hypothetical protein